MVKYPFSSKLMFAIVMHDEEACRQFIEKLFPEKKVKEIHFRERNEGDKLKLSRDQSREYEEENDIHPFSGRNAKKVFQDEADTITWQWDEMLCARVKITAN